MKYKNINNNEGPKYCAARDVIVNSSTFKNESSVPERMLLRTMLGRSFGPNLNLSNFKQGSSL